MRGKPRRELMLSLAKLHKSGSYSDFKITCRTTEHCVHKAIVCPRSRFFAVACDDAFREGRTGVVDLPEDDPRIVRLMVHYFYHLSYPEISLDDADTAATGQQVSTEKKSCLKLHAMVYALAEKYSVDGLKHLAMTEFRRELYHHWDSDDFLHAVEYAYTSTVEADRGLRDLIIQTIADNRSILRKATARAIVKRVECLAYDLLMALENWLPDAMPQPNNGSPELIETKKLLLPA